MKGLGGERDLGAWCEISRELIKNYVKNKKQKGKALKEKITLIWIAKEMV